MAEQRPWCLITGAAGGIGRGLVEQFSGAGYAVIATDRSSDSGDLPCAHFIEADLDRTAEDPEYAEAVFAGVRACLNGAGLAALINNAAIQVRGGVDELTRDDWSGTLRVNLLAPFFWTQALLPELEASGGCVVNVSSIHARLTKPRFVAYATSKAALSGLTRAMAVDLGGRVRVNGIEPAAIDTPMLHAGLPDARDYERLASYHPAGRLGTVGEVARLAHWLCSADSAFLHGAVIGLEGGIGGRLHDPEGGGQ